MVSANKTAIFGLYTTNSALSSVIVEAMAQVGLPCKTIKDVQQEDYSQYLAILTDQVMDTPLACPVFGLFHPKSKINPAFQKDCDRLIELPLRLGKFCDDLVYYASQKSIKEKLKPIKMGAYVLDPQHNRLFCPHLDSNVQLTDKEYQILSYLHQTQGQKISRPALLENVWGYVEGVETHTLETHIYRLRQKIEKDPSAPKFLMTDDEGYFLRL